MTDTEYKTTQDQLLQAGAIVSLLDLEQFLQRARSASAGGPIFHPTLYRDAGRNLDAVIDLAERMQAVKEAFTRLRVQVEGDE